MTRRPRSPHLVPLAVAFGLTAAAWIVVWLAMWAMR
jgi:hypothetical protein